jgi:glyoxylase-like metal-dependent hydrolase (beta-lactamase superfamily II)
MNLPREKMRIAERWWERQAFSDGVTRLFEPHVHPLIRCNVWHVQGRERDLVIDTGVGVASLRPALADVVGRPVVAVATHIHWDHVGGLHEFDERVMHELEAGRMNPYDEFATILRSGFEDGVLGFLAGIGFPIEEETLIDALPEAGYDPAGYRVVPTTPTRQVRDGEILDLGDRHFEVLHLPGHSPGSMGLWEEETRTLFSGDAIYDGTLIDLLPDSSIPDYIETMKRLRETPASVVHGGHEESFGRERLLELIDAYLESRA